MWHSNIFRKYCKFWQREPISCQKRWSKIQKIWHKIHALYALRNFTHIWKGTFKTLQEFRCCPCHSLFKGHYGWYCFSLNVFVIVIVIVFVILLVRLCLLITLIACLRGNQSLRVLYDSVFQQYVVVSKSVSQLVRDKVITYRVVLGTAKNRMGLFLKGQVLSLIKLILKSKIINGKKTRRVFS